jgi:hypothetical protein
MNTITITTIALIFHTGQARQVTVTAYCPCRQAGPPGLPFGTLVAVPGYGLVPVLDRGGSIRRDRLDVFFPTHGEALEWGRRVLVVWVWNGFGG